MSARPAEWDEAIGPGPVVAVAAHDGSAIRASLHPHLAIAPADRRREEDPGTGAWARLAPTWVVARRSRFEADLNRAPEHAVYLAPDAAWGLRVWRGALPGVEIAASRALHARFHARLGEILERKVAEEGGFVLLDVHAYNHRRAGPEGPEADPAENPEIDIATGTLDRARWGTVVDRFLADLRAQREVPGLDVRENVRFRGGYIPRSVNDRFGTHGVAFGVEFKKTSVDEWTGAIDVARHAALGRALVATFAGLCAELAARREAERGGASR